MFEITDLHNHSLCGLDDGADSYETMCGMLEKSYDNGVRCICFTPHYNNNARGDDCTLTEIMASYQLAREYCDKYLPGMRLYVGSEMLYHFDCIDSIAAKKLLTIANSCYVLTDFYKTPDARSIILGLERLLNCGYIPIVAHVERYPCLFGRIDDIRRMSMLGAVIQINAASIFGGLMSKSRRQCLKLLDEEIVDVVASDAHNLSTRSPDLKKAAEFVASKFGNKYAERIFRENPERIISDRRL